MAEGATAVDAPYVRCVTVRNLRAWQCLSCTTFVPEPLRPCAQDAVLKTSSEAGAQGWLASRLASGDAYAQDRCGIGTRYHAFKPSPVRGSHRGAWLPRVECTCFLALRGGCACRLPGAVSERCPLRPTGRAWIWPFPTMWAR